MDGGGADGGRDIIGSSVGAADRARRDAALDVANILAAAQGEAREDALDHAAYDMGRLVGQGFDRAEAGTMLFASAGRCGLLAEVGVDKVQSAIAECMGEGEKSLGQEILPASGPPPIEVFDGDDDEPIPPREWQLGTSLCRQFVTLLIAPGGTGKTALLIGQLLAVASGISITGEHIFERSRVLLLCFEDSLDEIRRRIRACRLHHNLPNLRGWLFFAVLTRAHGKLLMQQPPAAEGEQQPDLAKAIDDLIVRHDIGVLGLDPLKKVHGKEENDNTAMDEVMQVLSDMAIARNIAIAAAHHTSKGAMEAGNADKARGASSMRDAARIVKTVMPMGSEEAQLFGVDERERHFMVRLDNAKTNLAPPVETQWFRLTGVPLGNGTDRYPNGDNVQTVESWSPPDTWAGMNIPLTNEILDEIDAGVDGERFTNHASARKPRQAWAVIQARLPDKTDRQARAIIEKWISNGVLEYREYVSKAAKGAAKGLHLNHTKRPQ